MTSERLILVSAADERMSEVVSAISGIESTRIMEIRDVYSHSLFAYDSLQRKLSANGDEVRLTGGESRVMSILASVPNEPITAKILASSLIESETIVPTDRRNVGTVVCTLRKKLQDLVGEREVIKTVRALGYMLVDPAE